SMSADPAVGRLKTVPEEKAAIDFVCGEAGFDFVAEIPPKIEVRPHDEAIAEIPFVPQPGSNDKGVHICFDPLDKRAFRIAYFLLITAEPVFDKGLYIDS